jgi:hypothetical protein|tara:strand:+ start:372 stop:1886 length:1515 start_codon:yes stop_codon:yes gene_type:complete
MEKLYKFYFTSNDGRTFSQALELAELAHKHEILKDGNETCHVVTFNEQQIELMALFYNVAGNLRTKGSSYTMAGLWSRIEITSRLEEEGYYRTYPNNPKKPREFVPKYIEIRKLISERNFAGAVQKYYASIGSEFYGFLHKELVYLKKIGRIHFKGRDLLAFKVESDQSNLIKSNIREYCDCLDNTIRKWMENDLQLPLDILTKSSPAIEDLDKEITVVNLNDNGIEKTSFTLLVWYYGRYALSGRLFDRYLDLVKLCDIEEEKKYNLGRYARLWTTYSPAYYQKEVIEKGYYLNYIEIFKYGVWKTSKREPDFVTLSSLEKVKKYSYHADGIQYTGRNHKIKGKEFFEINILEDSREKKVIGNAFLELVEEILREGENMLREAHGLPKIGEGWVSEMELFNLVQYFFPNAQHHVSPEWLKPQHLDIYIHSEELAFEYQGQQHYEPVDFFGGLKSFEEGVRRDKRKRLKCKKNGVLLIYWKYDEEINEEVLKRKLEKFCHDKTE